MKTFSKQTIIKQLKKIQTTIHSKLHSKHLFKSLSSYFFNPRLFDAIQLNKFNILNDESLRKLIEKKGIKEIKTAIALTDLGMIKFNENSRSILKKFLPLAHVSDTSEKYISAFTYNDCLHIGLCYDPTLISEKEIEKFKTSLTNQLNQIPAV